METSILRIFESDENLYVAAVAVFVVPGAQPLFFRERQVRRELIRDSYVSCIDAKRICQVCMTGLRAYRGEQMKEREMGIRVYGWINGETSAGIFRDKSRVIDGFYNTEYTDGDNLSLLAEGRGN